MCSGFGSCNRTVNIDKDWDVSLAINSKISELDLMFDKEGDTALKQYFKQKKEEIQSLGLVFSQSLILIIKAFKVPCNRK